jgi:hypothetical protein
VQCVQVHKAVIKIQVLRVRIEVKLTFVTMSKCVGDAFPQYFIFHAHINAQPFKYVCMVRNLDISA